MPITQSSTCEWTETIGLAGDGRNANDLIEEVCGERAVIILAPVEPRHPDDQGAPLCLQHAKEALRGLKAGR